MLFKFMLLAIFVASYVLVTAGFSGWRDITEQFTLKNCNTLDNEVYTTNGGCESTCQTGTQRKCAYSHSRYWPACECKIGYLRNSTGVCVKEEDCPTRGEIVCNETNHEYFTQLGGCEPTCEIPWPDCDETLKLPACECSPGYVRNSTVQCIRNEDCRNGNGLPKIIFGKQILFASNQRASLELSDWR